MSASALDVFDRARQPTHASSRLLTPILFSALIGLGLLLSIRVLARAEQVASD